MVIEIQWTQKTPASDLFFSACSCYCFIILFHVSFLSFFLLAEYKIRVFFLHFSCLPYRHASTDLALSTSPTSINYCFKYIWWTGSTLPPIFRILKAHTTCVHDYSHKLMKMREFGGGLKILKKMIKIK